MLENSTPLATLVLFSYNQERYIAEAVNSALSQTYKKLEIIISDDCSTDSTFEIITSLVSNYSGPHAVSVNRNSINLGLVSHFNKITASARGEVVIVAAGDDISLPDRASNTMKMFNADPNASIVSFTDIIIDADGRELSTSLVPEEFTLGKTTLLDYVTDRAAFVSGASRGYRKTIFNTFGYLNSACPTEDTPSLLRGLIIGPALISSKPGIKYRRHESNLSNPKSVHSMKINEIRNQYIVDAGLSLKNNIISKEAFDMIKIWIENNYNRRLVSAELYHSANEKSYFFRKVIFNERMSFFNKLEIFIRMLYK
jgi:glycosyltransferase involved in cell wall biosynthesis